MVVRDVGMVKSLELLSRYIVPRRLVTLDGRNWCKTVSHFIKLAQFMVITACL